MDATADNHQNRFQIHIQSYLLAYGVSINDELRGIQYIQM